MADEDIVISHDSEVAKEAAAMARGLLDAKLAGIAAAMNDPVTAVVDRALAGSTNRERREFLACLLSSLCYLADRAADQADIHHPRGPLALGTTLAAVLKTAEMNGITF